ncbi:MAG TPA: hypothetical protein DIT04_05195 [Dysgonomonas sp.]|nr:hypothetical protein [Dysgonomonas sp.]
MENLKKPQINIETVQEYLTKYIFPKQLAELLDEFLYNYMIMLVQLAEEGKIIIDKDTPGFIYYMKLLRDTLRECED